MTQPRLYYPFSQYLKERFGCKVYKITVDAGFSCPHRRGRTGIGGCSFCVNESFSPNLRRPEAGIREQIEQGAKRLRKRYRAAKFIAYFQPFTNTSAPVATLQRVYDEALCSDDIVGLAIGTRPDCVSEETLDLIAGYAETYEVWIEYGLQSANDETLAAIDRGHDFSTFQDAMERTAGRRIRACAHVILGLPGEGRCEMLNTAKQLSQLPIDGLKIHHLHIVRGSALEQAYRDGRLPTLTVAEYVSLAADFLERTKPKVVIQRLVGDAPRDLLIAPLWEVGKADIVRAIEDEMRRRGTCQGARCP